MFRIKFIILLSLCILSVSGFSQEQYFVSTLAGDTVNMYKGIDSNAGYRNGAVSTALFNGPSGIAVDAAGNVYVADTYNNIIRKINVTSNTVSTIAGDTADIHKGLDSNAGYLDGSAMSAMFNTPLGVCVDKAGNVYVADTYNSVIRKISTSGVVTTYAGKDSLGMTVAGYINGPDSLAEFFDPISLAIDTSGNIYVTDEGNNAIREIWASTGMVTTLAGKGFDSAGYINGPVSEAEFATLYGITLGTNGAIYASQFGTGYNAVRRLYNGIVTTYAGYDSIGFDTTALWFNNPLPNGYQNGKQIIGRGDSVIDIDTALGDTIITYIPVGVLFNDPTGIAFDTAQNLLIADEYNNVIRIFNRSDSIVSTLAGNYSNNYDSITFKNGWDSIAVFYNPMGVAADTKGNIYVADLGNNLIRKITLQPISSIPTVKKPVNMLHIYPNPCSDRLNIVCSITGKADLLDVTGRVIWTENNFKSPYTLSTSAISPGIYFLRVSSASASEIRKVEVVR